MSANDLLPAGFETLEPFVASWVIASAADRLQRRLTSSDAERVAFFNAAKGLAPAALAFLDRKPLNQLDEKEQRLMNLMLSFCHVALAVEIQGNDELKHALVRQHLRITRASSDLH